MHSCMVQGLCTHCVFLSSLCSPFPDVLSSFVCCFLTGISSPTSRLRPRRPWDHLLLLLWAVPVPKSRGTRTPKWAARSLSIWRIPRTPQVMSPRCSSKKNYISEDSDATPINDPDRDNLSDFSRVTRESTGRFGVSNVCVDPSVLHGVLPEKRQLRETESSDQWFSHVSCDRHQLRETGSRQREREREDRETGYCRRLASERTRTWNPGSVISIDESVSRKSRRNIANGARSKISHSHQTQHEFSSENTLNGEHDKLSKVKIQLRENCILLSMMWRSKIYREASQNMHYMSLGKSLNPRVNNCDKQFDGQIMLNEKELTCVASWSERIVFIKRATQEVAKKLKNWKDAAFKKKMK